VLDRGAKEIKLKKKTPTNSKDVLFFKKKENIVSEKNTHPACKIAGEKKKRD
jgi:hypothetical protein